MKITRVIKILIFIMGALSIIDFMTENAANSAGRFQFNGLKNSELFRTIVDITLLTSLVILVEKHWSQKCFGVVFWLTSLLYTFLIIPDLISWVVLTKENPIYLVIILVHTLPIIVILNQFIKRIS